MDKPRGLRDLLESLAGIPEGRCVFILARFGGSATYAPQTELQGKEISENPRLSTLNYSYTCQVAGVCVLSALATSFGSA